MEPLIGDIYVLYVLKGKIKCLNVQIVEQT
jgi:hypothetical protein